MKPLMTVGITYATNWSLIRPKPYHSMRLRDNFCPDGVLCVCVCVRARACVRACVYRGWVE